MSGGDYQTVSIALSGTEASPAPSAYLNGRLYAVTSHCGRCGQRFDVGHVAQTSWESPGVWRHTDCDDPTLAADTP
jgi:hypothetical protein